MKHLVGIAPLSLLVVVSATGCTEGGGATATDDSGGSTGAAQAGAGGASAGAGGSGGATALAGSGGVTNLDGGTIRPDAGAAAGRGGNAAAADASAAMGGMAGTPSMGGASGTAGTGGAAPMVDPRLLTYDDFDTGPTGDNPTNLATGFGWTTERIAVDPGWAFHAELSQWRVVADAPKPSFANLLTKGNYLRHNNDGAGRCVDLKAYGTLAVQEGGDPAYLGVDGTSLWLSVLVRVNDVSDNPVFFAMSNSPIPWNTKDTVWAVGTAQRHTGNRKWSIFTRTVVMPHEPDVPRDATVTVTASSKEMTPKTTALLVVRFDFHGTADTINLYVDPPSLGGAPPAAPDAVATSKQDLKLRCFQGGMYQGSTEPTPDRVSFDFDEIRLGTSFQAVTPIH